MGIRTITFFAFLCTAIMSAAIYFELESRGEAIPNWVIICPSLSGFIFILILLLEHFVMRNGQLKPSTEKP